MINSIQINKTAKYATFGNPEKAIKILFVLHGYGQLAEFFIRKFNVLNPDEYFVVAPEGLHRFYLKGSSGRVGASWMTKEQRETDINDYVNYLNQLWNGINASYSFDEKILLGFSQGGATASRWHNSGSFKADKFILWAAVFPPDMQLENSNNFKESENYMIFGESDEYYDIEKVDSIFEELNSKTNNFTLIKFDGNHNIHSETLLNLI
jgi:predicted esterase